MHYVEALISYKRVVMPRWSWSRANRMRPWVEAVIYNVLQHIFSTCSLVGTRSKVYLNIAIGKKLRFRLGSTSYRPRGKHYSVEASAHERRDLSRAANYERFFWKDPAEILIF